MLTGGEPTGLEPLMSCPKGTCRAQPTQYSEGNLHVGQEVRQVRCPTVFDISIEQHSTLSVCLSTKIQPNEIK
jgi:hypothetical protein